MDMLTNRLPPHDRDAERGVLGGILRDPETMPDVQQIVTEASFYFDAHRKIYAALCELTAACQPLDLVLLFDRLKRNKHLDDVGGQVYLAELWESIPTGANVSYHAKLVRDAATVRGLIHAGNEIVRDGYDRIASADELVGQAERKIMDVARQAISGETHDFASVLQAAFDRVDARLGKDSLGLSGLPTGFVDLDNLTAGLQKSELVVVGARPSVGKTATALAVVRNIITTTSDPVLFVSLEMSRTELAERLLCAEARVDSHRVRRGHLSGDEIQRLMDAGDRFKRGRLFIDDTPSRTMTQIAAACRRTSKKEEKYGGLKLLVVDYLQMIEPEDRRAPRQEQVAAISRRLKILARELAIPVMALCQLNRASEDRQDHRPRLSDLRESGGIEADADVVMLLHRPGRFDGGGEDNVLDIDIAKQRNGPTGLITLSYDKRYGRYDNYAPDRIP